MGLPALFAYINGALTEVLFGRTGGSTDANKPLALDANGLVPYAAMPAELQPNIDTFKASEALAAGAFVTYVTDASGVTTVKNAVGSAWATQAMGHVKAAVAANATATIYALPDKNNAVALDPAKLGHQWLSTTTPGAATNVPPTGAGNISQYLGYATSTTTIHTVCHPPLLLAQ